VLKNSWLWLLQTIPGHRKVDENKRLKSELRKALSSNSQRTKGDIRKDNDWNGEEVNLSDRVSLFCRDYMFL